ncbi:putative lipoprotein [Helicobacter pylori R038b]|uniref:Putative lipoprotein n=1 Tax=Helicobacter pylori R038b TaxID=1145115 RepID=K2LST2_HELPX|nr:putative lipoprotein [Helicobacter pylori R038b]
MRTKLSPNISLGSPIALAFGCFTNETNKKICCYKLVKSYKKL